MNWKSKTNEEKVGFVIEILLAVSIVFLIYGFIFI